MLDTLGWIEHLLGDDESAVRSLAQASKLAPTLAEARFHAAIVFGALGALPNARTELAEALKLDPSLAKHEETLKLQQRLKSLKN
jgi:Flp pilus assembly protein TadD